MLIDSHCHLHNPAYFSEPASAYLDRAAAAGVEQVVVIGTSYADSVAAARFAAKHGPDRVFWTFGVHPSELEKPYSPPDFSSADFSASRPIAIGEVGLDYHYGPADYGGLELSFEELRRRQFRLLEEMLDLGLKHDLPFSFHVREAFADFFAILDNFSGRPIRGVIHSFSDNKQNLRRALDRGFYIGVNGLATYSTLPQPPLEAIVLETDAPFLAPVPHRHEPNEPAYIRDIAAWAATQYGVSLEQVADVTTANFNNIFRTEYHSASTSPRA